MERSADMREVLGRVPLFRAFNAQELDGLAALCAELVLDKGEVVCRAGEEGDRLFVLASGELEVWAPQGDRLLNRLGPGELVGEMSLLLGTPRSATVTVSRPARLLAIDKPSFERYFLHNAKVLEHLSRYLARRLATIARGETVARATTVIAVTARAGLGGKTLVAGALAAILRRLTGDDVLLVHLDRAGGATSSLATLADAGGERLGGAIATQSGPLAPELVVAAVSRDGERRLIDDLSRLVAQLAERFAAIVLDVGDGPGLDRAAAAVADVSIEIVDRVRPGGRDARDGQRFQVLNLHNPATAPIAVNHCEPFVLPVEPGLRGLDPAARALWVCEHRTAPIGRSLHRLVRKLLGMSVGLALGGGAAFGIAHVGVLKVLEDDGVPIDVIAGTSMGSIVGVGYASGIPPAEMVAIARRIGNWRTTLSAVLDPTLVRPGLLSGDRMAAIFARVAGSAETFADLAVPFRAVAADAETGERVSIGTGSLAMAYRASAAVPIIWAPIKIGDRVLIDGSMVDPVPGEVVREMGGDLCIAVNVVPPLRRGVQTVLARWYHRLNRLNPLAILGGSQGMPSMFDLCMNTIQMLQYELGNYRAISADVLINPDLGEFTWIEFYRAGELVDRGMAAAERALPQIRRLLADRLAARGRGTPPHDAPPALVFGDDPGARTASRR